MLVYSGALVITYIPQPKDVALSKDAGVPNDAHRVGPG